MDPTPIASIAGRYHALRGWLSVPTGALFLGAGAVGLPPIGDEEVPDGAVWFLPFLCLLAVAYYGVHRYYVTTFGRVRPTATVQVRLALSTLAAALVIGAGITVDAELDLPISLYAVTFAASLLAYHHRHTGLRVHHWLAYGGVAALGLLPVWGGTDDATSLALVPMGLATIAVGLFDHRELVRSMAAARASLRSGVEVGA